MFIVHFMSLMLSHHLHVHRQSSFFLLGVVHNSVQIVPEHLHQMSGVIVSAIVGLQGYTNTL